MKKIYVLVVALFCLGIGIVNGQYRILFNFNGTDGSGPEGNLTLSGGKFYGMTSEGGVNGLGCIFSIDTNGSGYKDLFDFNGTNGRWPQGSLTLSGKKLYGMTSEGGVNSFGNTFSIDTNGSEYEDMLDFNIANGQYVYGTLALSGKILYGMAWEGGADDYGTIFCIDTNGSGYKDLHDFNNTTGGYAWGSLLLSGSKLYGMTMLGGISHDGNVFSIDTNGSGYQDLFDFNGINGNQPRGDLTISGKILYGMTSEGGIYGDGNIFSIHTSGIGYKDLLDFNNMSGRLPYGGLTLSGKVLYGTTSLGGLGAGEIFSIDTNYGSRYTNLLDFFDTNGAEPMGSLTLLGGVLYGTAESGGAYGVGVIFRADTSGIQMKDSITIYSNVNCFGEGTGSAGVSAYGGTLPYTFNWSPGGATTASVSGLSAGTYTVSVADWENYSIINFVTITQPSFPLQVTISTVPAGCKSNNGSASASVSGGTPPYTYYWYTSGSTSSTATGLSAGEADYAVTDSLGCYTSGMIKVMDSGTLKVNIVSLSAVTCFGGNNGIAIASVSGGTKPYTYSWYPSGGTDSIAAGLSAGGNIVTIIDSNGCIADTSVSIGQGMSFNIEESYTIDSGSCSDSAWVVVSNGIPPYTYLWSSGQTTDSIFNQCKGIDTCTVTDSDGCTESIWVPIGLVGIPQLKNNREEIHVYPNPNKGTFTLQIENGQLTIENEKPYIEVYNVLGEKVVTETLCSAQGDNLINLTGQPDGVYLYRVITEDGGLVGQGKVIVLK